VSLDSLFCLWNPLYLTHTFLHNPPDIPLTNHLTHNIDKPLVIYKNSKEGEILRGNCSILWNILRKQVSHELLRIHYTYPCFQHLQKGVREVGRSNALVFFDVREEGGTQTSTELINVIQFSPEWAFFLQNKNSKCHLLNIFFDSGGKTVKAAFLSDFLSLKKRESKQERNQDAEITRLIEFLWIEDAKHECERLKKYTAERKISRK
jgi:hypothetical protein